MIPLIAAEVSGCTFVVGVAMWQDLGMGESIKLNVDPTGRQHGERVLSIEVSFLENHGAMPSPLALRKLFQIKVAIARLCGTEE